jgi:small-conductance mechanosensitive channel
MTDMDRTAHGHETGAEAAQEVGAKGPDELRQQIQRTRSELGDTVEQLAGKADVKGRVQARAADLRDKAGAMTVQLRSTAAQAGHTVQGKASRAGHTVQGKASRAGHAVQGKAHAVEHTLQDKAHTAEHNLPVPVRNAVEAGRRNPRPVLIAGAAAVGAVVAVEVLRRRRHGR